MYEVRRTFIHEPEELELGAETPRRCRSKSDVDILYSFEESSSRSTREGSSLSDTPATSSSPCNTPRRAHATVATDGLTGSAIASSAVAAGEPSSWAALDGWSSEGGCSFGGSSRGDDPTGSAAAATSAAAAAAANSVAGTALMDCSQGLPLFYIAMPYTSTPWGEMVPCMPALADYQESYQEAFGPSAVVDATLPTDASAAGGGAAATAASPASAAAAAAAVSVATAALADFGSSAEELEIAAAQREAARRSKATASRSRAKADSAAAGKPRRGSDSPEASSQVNDSCFDGSSADDESTRTTVMLRNLPNDYSRDMLLQLLDSEGFKGCYDFVYLPVDFSRWAGFGYAFVNMASPAEARRIREALQGFSSWEVPSQKVVDVCWGNPLQGLEACVERYRNSPVMNEAVPEKFKPLVFQDGERVPFPAATKRIRNPRAKKGYVNPNWRNHSQ